MCPHCSPILYKAIECTVRAAAIYDNLSARELNLCAVGAIIAGAKTYTLIYIAQKSWSDYT